jgi:hypothetical protein
MPDGIFAQIKSHILRIDDQSRNFRSMSGFEGGDNTVEQLTRRVHLKDGDKVKWALC